MSTGKKLNPFKLAAKTIMYDLYEVFEIKAKGKDWENCEKLISDYIAREFIPKREY